jgi:hypothetical protein
MNKLKRNKYKSSWHKENLTFFLFLSGMVTLIINIIGGKESLLNDPTYIVILKAFGFISVGLYFYFLMKEDSAKRSKDEFKDFIDNKHNLKSLLLDIFKAPILDSKNLISLDEFKNRIVLWHKNSDEKNWLRNLFLKKENVESFIDDLGIDEFIFLLMTKSENSSFLSVTDESISFSINLSRTNVLPPVVVIKDI